MDSMADNLWHLDKDNLEEVHCSLSVSIWHLEQTPLGVQNIAVHCLMRLDGVLGSHWMMYEHAGPNHSVNDGP